MSAVIQGAFDLPSTNAIEAEQALLGAMLSNNACVPLVVGRIKPDQFFEPIHARIFNAIVKTVQDNGSASPVTLAPWFREDETLKEIGGVAYLARLASSATTIVSATGYADAIVDAWVRRSSLSHISSMSSRLATRDYETDAVTIIREELSAIAAIAEIPNQNRRQLAGRIGDDVVDAVNRKHMGEEVNVGAKIGLTSLDNWLHCWEEQSLYLVAARPSMGKTTFGTSVLLKTVEQGGNVLFFSLEMSRKQLVQRMLSDLAWRPGAAVTYKALARGELTDHQVELLVDANRKLKLLPFTIDDRGGLTVEQMRATATVEKQRLEGIGKKLHVVAIDHGSLIKGSGRFAGNRVNELEDITGDLKGMAKALNCAVVCLLQLSRQVESRDNKRPILSDLRGSGSWEQDADVVMFLYREAYYLEKHREDDMAKEAARMDRLALVKNKLEVLIEKNRMGETGILDMFTSMPSSVVRDIAHG